MGILDDLDRALRAVEAAPPASPHDVLADLEAVLGHSVAEPVAPVPVAASVTPAEAARPDGWGRLCTLVEEARPVAAEPPEPTLRATIEEQVAADPQRLPWPATWWGRADPADVKACRTMWQAVLRHCLQEALGEIEEARKRAAKNGTGVRNVVDAGWIGSKEFRLVADLAGFDGEAAQSRLLAQLGREGGREAVRERLRESGEDRRARGAEE